MHYDYDLIVIGGGSGGVRAARKAALYGARVAMCEGDRVGGTCVMRGCVPKKLMVYASEFREAFEDASHFGWKLPEVPEHDFGGLMGHIATELDRLEDIYKLNLRKAGADLFSAYAELQDAHTVLLSDGRRLTAQTILIATGGKPNPHEALEGHGESLLSDDVFALREIPKRLVVLGSGYIGTEFAGVFNGLGSHVTMVYRGQDILTGFDHDVRSRVHRAYVRRGIETRAATVLHNVRKDGDEIVATTSDDEEIRADAVLLAVGRIPNTEGLGLDRVGVALGQKGHVLVDGDHRTNVDNIYAIGDVTGEVELTPYAIRQGEVFASALFGDGEKDYVFDVIPTSVFSQPPAGTVGPREEDALETYPDLDVYCSEFRPMRGAFANRDERMFFKLLVNAQDDRVVAAHLFGADTPELVQVIAIAINAKVTKRDFDRTMALHPSASEELVTMGEPRHRYRGGKLVEKTAIAAE